MGTKKRWIELTLCVFGLFNIWILGIDIPRSPTCPTQI